MTSPRRGAPWRMRTWPYDPTIALVVFTDLPAVPTRDQLVAIIEEARRRGARLLRTSALTDAALAAVVDTGFERIDRLALLRRSLTSPLAAGPRMTHPLRPRDYRSAAETDLLAFGPLWANDAPSLRDINDATPLSRARGVLSHAGRRRVVGFAVSGVAGRTGYLQRLAVHPSHRRVGVAHSLVADATDWMQRTGATSALVNTGVHNAGALALYDRLGFVRLEQELSVAELDLRRGSRATTLA